MTAYFADLKPDADAHFQILSYAAVSHVLYVLEQNLGSREPVLKEFPFLSGYYAELDARGLAWNSLEENASWWQAAFAAWESQLSVHLPLRAVREACGLSAEALTLLVWIGLVEEDARFGLLFESYQGPGFARPTVGLLNAWWDNRARPLLRQLSQHGLVQVLNPDAPRSEQMLHVPAPVWEAAQGLAHADLTPWAHYQSVQELTPLAEMVLPGAISDVLPRLPGLIAQGDVRTLVVRGPSHNGRRSLLRGLAHELKRGVIEVAQPRELDLEQWRMLQALAALLHALPVLCYELAPGESAVVPLNAESCLLGIVTGMTGGLSGPGIERALTIALDAPDLQARRVCWQRAAQRYPVADVDALSRHFRLTSGNLHQVIPLAHVQAQMNAHAAMTLLDVQQAARGLQRQSLEPLAARLDVFGDWSHLAVNEDTRRDLEELETRCRQRDLLSMAVGPAFGTTINSGVRALLTGPSGTGKTLAARVLAAQLQMDLYRLDLSAVVNKYIGETEKNLNQVFARAEELDIILLIDEGDALLAQRTNVSSANDRYANLETNFLLQRLETYRGIVIITTNASERIDRAFQRRMDVVVDFRPPEASERWNIWQLHLPESHAVDERFLNDVVVRCALTGGQIRNAALHAALLAVQSGGCLTNAHLEEAVKREYRQTGAVCPLRPARLVTAEPAWERG